MKIPDKCPCCQGILTNKFIINKNILNKECDRYTNHRYSCVIHPHPHGDELVRIGIEIDNTKSIRAYWWFITKQLGICQVHNKTMENIVYLPFFEPDFLDYKKLINKLKTYIVFM